MATPDKRQPATGLLSRASPVPASGSVNALPASPSVSGSFRTSFSTSPVLIQAATSGKASELRALVSANLLLSLVETMFLNIQRKSKSNAHTEQKCRLRTRRISMSSTRKDRPRSCVLLELESSSALESFWKQVGLLMQQS
jgi:hypothetical protein